MSDRDIEQAAFATLEMLVSQLNAGQAGPVIGKALQIARKAYDTQDDPEAYLQTLLDGIEAAAQAAARARWG